MFRNVCLEKCFENYLSRKNWSMWVIENRKYRPVMTLVIIFLIDSKIPRFDWLKFQLGWFEELYETRGGGDLHRCSREVRRGPWGGLLQRQKRTLSSNEKTSTGKVSWKTNKTQNCCKWINTSGTPGTNFNHNGPVAQFKGQSITHHLGRYFVAVLSGAKKCTNETGTLFLGFCILRVSQVFLFQEDGSREVPESSDDDRSSRSRSSSYSSYSSRSSGSSRSRSRSRKKFKNIKMNIIILYY